MDPRRPHAEAFRLQVTALLALTGLVGSLLLILLVSAASTVQETNRIQTDLEEQGVEIAHRLSQSISKALWDFDRESARQILLGEVTNRDVVRILLLKTNQEPFLEIHRTSDGKGTALSPEDAPLPPVPRGQFESRAPVVYQNTVVGHILVQQTDEMRLAQFHRELRAGLLTQLGISFAVVLLTLAALQIWIIRPLVRLAMIVKRFSLQEFHHPIPQFSTQEMHELGTGLATMVRTITEYQTEMERLVDLRTAQLVESAKFAQLGLFITGLAHEMNTPIGNALTSVSFLQQRIDDHVSQDQGQLTRSRYDKLLADLAEAAGSTQRNVLRAAQFLSVLKTIGADNNLHEEEPVDLGPLIGDILGGFQYEAMQKGVLLEQLPGADEKLVLFPSILHQVLGNLILLTLDYAFSGTTGGSIQVQARYESDLLTLECTDNGCGLTDDRVRLLFSPFGLTGSALTTRQYLGPYLLRGLVQSVRGNLVCRTAPGQGTTFTITIPAKRV